MDKSMKKIEFKVSEINEMTEQGTEYLVDNSGVITKFYDGNYAEATQQGNSEETKIAD